MLHGIALFFMVQNPSPGHAGRWRPWSYVTVFMFGALAGSNGARLSMCVIETRNDIDVNKIVIDVISGSTVI
jgi:hypothetical protein